MQRNLPLGNYGTVDVQLRWRGDILMKTAAECLQKAISEMADASEVPHFRRLMSRMSVFLHELTVRPHALHQVEEYLQARGDVVGQRVIDLVELLKLPSKPPFALWTWMPIFIGLHAYAMGSRESTLAFSLPWPEEFEHSFEFSVTMSVSGIAYPEGRRKGLQPTASVPISLPWYMTPASKKVALAPQIKSAVSQIIKEARRLSHGAGGASNAALDITVSVPWSEAQRARNAGWPFLHPSWEKPAQTLRPLDLSLRLPTIANQATELVARSIVTTSSYRSTAGRRPSQNEARWWGRCVLDGASPEEVSFEDGNRADNPDAADAEQIVRTLRTLGFRGIRLSGLN
jgi:hypothetical protein